MGGVSDLQAFYLTVAGMDGGSTSAAHPGAFEEDSFVFDIANTIAQGGGGAEFKPLNIALNAGAHLNGLLSAAASGEPIASLRLADTRRRKPESTLMPTRF